MFQQIQCNLIVENREEQRKNEMKHEFMKSAHEKIAGALWIYFLIEMIFNNFMYSCDSKRNKKKAHTIFVYIWQISTELISSDKKNK